jgi:hypothetical protein
MKIFASIFRQYLFYENFDCEIVSAIQLDIDEQDFISNKKYRGFLGGLSKKV